MHTKNPFLFIYKTQIYIKYINRYTVLSLDLNFYEGGGELRKNSLKGLLAGIDYREKRLKNTGLNHQLLYHRHWQIFSLMGGNWAPRTDKDKHSTSIKTSSKDSQIKSTIQ